MSNEAPVKDWTIIVGVMLKVALGISLLYVGGVFLQRHWQETAIPERAPDRVFQEDLYVHVPGSHIGSASSAKRRLPGMDLWVREGYRWAYQPGDVPFRPLEKITPTRVFEQGGQTYVAFEKEGRTYTFAVSGGGRFFIDDIFYIKDPRALYGHWTEEDWRKIEAQEVEEGMSEFQITFALGFGELISQSRDQSVRTLEFKECVIDGCTPVRVVFRDLVATKIEPLEQ